MGQLHPLTLPPRTLPPLAPPPRTLTLTLTLTPTLTLTLTLTLTRWDSFDLVGVTEHFDEFLVLLTDLVGLQAPAYRSQPKPYPYP